MTNLHHCHCLDSVDDPDNWSFVTAEWMEDKARVPAGTRLPDDRNKIKWCPMYRIYHIRVNDDLCCLIDPD